MPPRRLALKPMQASFGANLFAELCAFPRLLRFTKRGKAVVHLQAAEAAIAR